MATPQQTATVPPARAFARLIRRFVRVGARDEVARVLDRLQALDVVQILRTMTVVERRGFVDILIGHPLASSVFADLPVPEKVEILSQVPDDRIARLLSRQPPDEAADLLNLLPPDRADAILKLLDEPTASNLDRLMTYGPETAGGLMTTRFLALPKSRRVSEAIARIRGEPDAEMVFYLYVVDEFGRLEGVVSLRQLVLARTDQTLNEIMNPRVIRVRTDQARAEVADLIARYNLLALPVVDAGSVLVGIVTVDDAIDAITDETTRELYRMAGLTTDDRVTSPPLASVRRRLPWMLVNLGTAVLASWVVWLFEGSIAQVVALATFMPVVAGMGGNGATQTLTVVIRGLALGELDFSTARRAILREILVGVTIGVVTGAVMALIALLWKGNAVLGLVIGLAMIINLFVAGAAGAAIPLTLKWLRLDPALGSGVIVTTFTDVFGFLSFLGLATLLLGYLV
ncbi:MAG TPA: magnesium transporter [Candidatus Polarisedimenticolia bacterium]|nr:magnesium transporter [Candidatus Polarisedimenticolia bacterium]